MFSSKNFSSSSRGARFLFPAVEDLFLIVKNNKIEKKVDFLHIFERFENENAETQPKILCVFKFIGIEMITFNHLCQFSSSFFVEKNNEKNNFIQNGRY